MFLLTTNNYNYNELGPTKSVRAHYSYSCIGEFQFFIGHNFQHAKNAEKRWAKPEVANLLKANSGCVIILSLPQWSKKERNLVLTGYLDFVVGIEH
jgi:hypothetical protein